MKAGSLEIQLLMDVAKLQKDMNDVKRSVGDGMGSISKATGAANDNFAKLSGTTKQYASDVARLKAQLDPAWAAQQKYNDATRLGTEAFKAGAISREQFITHMRSINAELKGAVPAMQRVGAVSGNTQQGMRQLGFQMNDVATQFASGTKASMIFAQQSGQVIQAVQMMIGGTSKFATFMQGPWGIALTVATVIMSSFIGKLLEGNNEAEKAKKVHQGLVDVLSDGKSAWIEITEAAADYARQQAKTTETTLDSAQAEAFWASKVLLSALAIRQKLDAQLALNQSQFEDFSKAGAGEAASIALGQRIDTQAKIDANARAMVALTAAAAAAQDKVAGLVAALRADPSKMVAEGFDQQRKAVNALGLSYDEQVKRLTEINKAERAAAESTKAHTAAQQQFGREIDLQQARAIAQGAGLNVTSGLRTRAEQQWLYDHKRTAQNPVAVPGTSAHESGNALDIGFGPGVTIAAIKKAYDEAGVHLTKVLTETGHFHIEWANKTADGVARAHELAAKRIAAAYAKAAKEVAEAMAKMVQEASLALVGMSEDLAKLVKDDIAAATESDLAKMQADFAAAQKARTQGVIDEAEARARVNDQLEQTINYLDKMGGIGSSLGNIGAIMRGLAPGVGNGNFSGVNGTIGGILGIISSTDQGKALVSKFGDVLDKTFGGAGTFAKTMTTVLQAAGSGAAIGGAITGGSKAGQIGGAVGGIIGAGAATLVSSALLGAILPGIGAIIGAILPGLFSGPDWGTAAIKNGQISTKGNKNEFVTASDQAANSLVQSINTIASTLGKTVGSYGISLGMDNGNWHVNTDGISGKLSSASSDNQPHTAQFATAAEAVAYALKKAIEGGAVEGLSSQIKDLLTNGTDINAQFAKVQKFQSVLDQVANTTDPAKVALDALAASMTDLTSVFQEANATTEQMASLATYEQTQRDAILAKAAQDAYDKARPARALEIQIMQLEGKSTEALAAARQLELDGMEAALRPLQQRINLLTDEATATQAAAAAKAANDNQHSDLVQKLADLQNAGLGKAMRRMAELAAITDDANRALQMQIYVAEDVAAARNVLAASYQRERAALVSASDAMHGFAASLYAIRQGLYANDNAGHIGSVRGALAGNDSGAAGSAVQAYLASAKDSARSLIDYQRQVGQVGGLIDQAIGRANASASGIDAQISYLDQSVKGLIDVNDNVVSVHDALADLNALLVPPTVEMANAQEEANRAAADFQTALVDQVKAMRDENAATSLRMIELTSSMNTFWKRAEVDGITVKGDPDQPVYTVAA